MIDGVAGIRLVPESIDFGSVPAESLPHEARVRVIVNDGRETPLVERFRCRCDDPRLAVRLEATERDGALLAVVLGAECSAGEYWSHVTIEEIDGGLSGRFPLHARVLGPHLSNPGTIMLDAGRSQDADYGRKLTISRRRDGTEEGLSIRDVIVPEPLRSAVSIQIKQPNTVTVTVTVLADVPPDEFRTRIQQWIRILTHDDLLGDSTVNVPVTVTLRSRDQLSGPVP